MTEQEQINLQEQIENGRKARVASEFLKDFLIKERAIVINLLETGDFFNSEKLVSPVMYLRVLRQLEMEAKSYIDIGEIAEKELSEYGK